MQKKLHDNLEYIDAVNDNSNAFTLTKLRDPDPIKRLHHSSTLVGHYIITFGGLQDSGDFSSASNTVTVLNIKDLTLQVYPEKESTPGPRHGHSACLIKENQILIFGGMTALGSTDEGVLMIIEDTEEKGFSLTWKKLELKNSLNRTLHTAHVSLGHMYIFGGITQSNEATNEVWCLDLNELIWVQCRPTGDIPDELWMHSSILYDRKVYTFGASITSNHGNLFMLDLANMKWHCIQSSLFPSPQQSTSATIYDEKVYVFGGLDLADTRMHEVFSYDLRDNVWSQLKNLSKVIPKRTRPPFICYQSSFIIWGGSDSQSNPCSDVYYITINSIEKQTNRDKAYIEQFKQLFLSTMYSDIAFIVEEIELPAHRCVLTMRCKYFNNLFSSIEANIFSVIELSILGKMAESEAKKINITDVKFATFKAYLEFIYANEVTDLTESLALDLLELSDKYSQDSLKDICEEFLLQCVTINNFVQMANKAERFQVLGLRNAVLEFIMKNMEKVKGRDDIFDLPKSILLAGLFQKVEKFFNIKG